MRNNALSTLLLVIILIYGGALRFVGQNWDDFSHTHPDELFLTLLVLPNLGGGNSYTDDRSQFPEQQILALRDSTTIRSRVDLRDQPYSRLGVVKDSFGAEAGKWLVNADQLVFFDSFLAAQDALIAGRVDALLADPVPITAPVTIELVDSLSSVDLQSLRCQRLYPATGGSGGYFDARCSPLNPHNAGHGFMAYGTLPILLAHYATDFVRSATEAGLPIFDFQGGHLVWRGLSMIFDILSILTVFALGARTHNRWVGLLAALLYASAPLAIQKAHFGTVNAIGSFFVVLALYMAVGVQQRGRMLVYLMFGVACGAAVASRINLAPLAAIIILPAAVQAMPAFDPRLCQRERAVILARQLFGLVLAGIGAFLAFRIVHPYAFNGPGVFGLTLNERWIADMERVLGGAGGVADYPPNWQWLARRPLVSLSRDMVFWGMGLSFGLLGWFGWCWAAYRLVRNRMGAIANLALIVWIIGYVVWMGRLWALTMRYYLPLYGALAVMAGWCLYELYQYASKNGKSLPLTSWLLASFGLILAAVGGFQVAIGAADATALSALVIGALLISSALLPPFNRYRPAILTAYTIGFAIIWALMHSNIYRHQSTLVQAARYVFERVPGDFAMEIEGADDSVPLINIAIDDVGLAQPGVDNAPLYQATLYREGEPTRVRFAAPVGGQVHSVFAPHLGDPLDDPEPEEVVIRVYAAGAEHPLAEATLRANLIRDEHPLGSAYTIPFDAPLQVVKGDEYEFEVVAAAGSGDFFGSGSVVLNEGAWDNRVAGIKVCELPDGLTLADDPPSGLVNSQDCRGRYAYSRLVNSQDQIMSHPVDDHHKYDQILESLEMGDYLTIASNRFYDTQTRNRARWPFTTLYYEKLFAGELGYDLIAVFDETFELGPWRVSDQHLPHYVSPAWLNELEADESFHVYDHPTAFIFKKSAEYSQAKVKAALSKISLKQVHELQGSDDEAQFLGVFYWSSAQADQAPTALMFTPEEYERQASGGTWSERFFSDSIINRNQAVGAVVWYATIFAFGALAFPLVFSLFPALADGGYGVCKLVGLLLVAWFAWASPA